MSAPEAMADDAEIHPGVPNVYFEIHNKKCEDTKSFMDKAEYVSETSTYSSHQPHLPIEPDCGNAYIDGEGRLTIHSKSIGIHLHAAMISTGMGVEAEKLRLVQNPAGGTFGYKFSPTMEALLGSEIAMDELAHKIGIDPFELRYKNIYREGSTTITGSVPDVFSLEEMFDTIRPKYYEAEKDVKNIIRRIIDTNMASVLIWGYMAVD